MKKKWQALDRRSCLLTFFSLAASILLHSLALTPLYLTLISNVSWQSTALPKGIAYLQLLLEYAFFWLLFAFLSKGLGKWHPAPLLFSILLACLVRHCLELVMGYAVMGFPTWQAFCEDELLYTLLQLFFDILLLAFAALVIKLVGRVRIRCLLLAVLPVLFQLVSLTILFFGYDAPSRKAFVPEALIDLAFHMVCFFAGFGVIFVWSRLLDKEKKS